MFENIYGQVYEWHQDTTMTKFELDFLPTDINHQIELLEGTISMNIEFFLMIFNRALRIKHRDPNQG